SKNGWMSDDWKNESEDVSHLLDMIIEHIPAAKFEDGTPQMQITSLDYSSFVGRIAVGRLTRGTLQMGMNVSLVKRDGKVTKSKIKELYLFEGLGKEKIKTPVEAGDIVALMGIEDFEIGDTVTDFDNPEGLPSIKIDEPTMSMLFTINNSPFFGKEGKYVTSRHLRDRLFLETEKNLALKVEETNSADSYLVFGRGILHLSILVETMRREGYEFQLGQPRVIIKEIDGVKHEPIESLTVLCPEDFSGRVIEIVSNRKGEFLNMEPKNDRMMLEFRMPSRGIIGLRNNILTSTEGEAIIAHRFDKFEPWKGDFVMRNNGALIAMETGTAIPFGIWKLIDRGKFYIHSNDMVYAGQVIGESTRAGDLVINVNKGKKLSNMRSSGSDTKVLIPPPIIFSLEEYMEIIRTDEYLEVTPRSLRLRKILLNEHDRKRASK
ncbi:MAG: translational GTPase TypA, partial [Marinilabiliales bacterium]